MLRFGLPLQNPFRCVSVIITQDNGDNQEARSRTFVEQEIYRNVNNTVLDTMWKWIQIANEPERYDVDPETLNRFVDFFNGMIEMGKKLSGEPTPAWFSSFSENEIEFLGMIPSAHGGIQTGHFHVDATLVYTLPGETGVRKKPPEGRLIVNSIFQDLVKLDARRFRRCVICNDIFYAKRLDKVCCSPEHSSIHRTNEYRKTRRTNHSYNKDKKRG